jgi:hypothetical protein
LVASRARRVEDHFQGGHEPIGAAAVNELAAGPGHALALQGIAEQGADGLAQGLRGDVGVPAEATARALFLQALGGRPVSLGLHEDQLGHADAGQFQRPGVPGGDGHVAAGDADGDLVGLADDFQAVGAGGGQGLQGFQCGVVGADQDIDTPDARAVEQHPGQLARLVGQVVVAQGHQGAEGLGRLLGPDRANAAHFRPDQGVTLPQEQLRAGPKLVVLPPRPQQRVDDEVGGEGDGRQAVEDHHDHAAVAQRTQVVLAHGGGIDHDRRRADAADLAQRLFQVGGRARRVGGRDPLVAAPADALGQRARVELRQEEGRPPAALQGGGQDEAAPQVFPADAGRGIDAEENGSAGHRSVP